MYCELKSRRKNKTFLLLPQLIHQFGWHQSLFLWWRIVLLLAINAFHHCRIVRNVKTSKHNDISILKLVFFSGEDLLAVYKRTIGAMYVQNWHFITRCNICFGLSGEKYTVGFANYSWSNWAMNSHIAFWTTAKAKRRRIEFNAMIDFGETKPLVFSAWVLD